MTYALKYYKFYCKKDTNFREFLKKSQTRELQFVSRY